MERVELLICLNVGLVSSAVNAAHGAGGANGMSDIEHVAFEQSMHCSQGFFAGKSRTFFKTVDVLPSKLPRPVEQQWKLFTICDSTHGALFVCHYIAENSLL